MLRNREVNTFLSLSFNKKNNPRLITNSALKRNDLIICGCDEIKKENNGSVRAIIKAFFFPTFVEMSVITGITRKAVATALKVPNQAGHCPAALVSPANK